MKIKTDFVTNSSSTAYIVFIPDDFKINEHLLRKIYLQKFEEFDYDDNTEKMTSSELYLSFEEYIEILKEGKSIWEHDITSVEYSTLLEIIDMGFVLADIDIGSEGNGTITGIKWQSILDILVSNTDFEKLLNNISNKGINVSNVVEKDKEVQQL